MVGMIRLRHRGHGQALVEFALVLPLLVLLVGGVIIFGVGVFYQQQLSNAAREAARYAALHSTTAQYTVDSNRQPSSAAYTPDSYQYGLGDVPPTWTRMTDAARNASFGLNRSEVKIAACWSGYWNVDSSGAKVSPDTYDALPPTLSPPDSAWFGCHIGGVDPRANASAIPCPPPATGVSDDEGSAIPGNSVTVYACYQWVPPLAGFLFLPDTITMRAVVTEVIHRQQ